MNQSIFFSAGEPSGDQHTARLIRSLAVQNPGLKFRGFGGTEMEHAGCQLDFELTQLAVMGLVEVAPKLREFYRVANIASKIFQEETTDAVVLVDFPGFNWHIAKRAKKHNIPVYYYLPPQLWAWASWRIKKIRRYVDKVLCVLPFEYEWYRERGIDAEYVGHPFFDAVAEKKLDQNLLSNLALRKASGEQLIAVLPGSRQGEVTGNWPIQIEVIRRLAKQYTGLRFSVACFRDKHCLYCREQLTSDDANLPIDFFVNKTSEIVEASECALMVSGSVSLELMARTTPAVVMYRLGRVFNALASRLVSLESITLPNLIAGKTIYPEFLAVGDPAPAIDNLVASMSAMIGDQQYRDRIKSDLVMLQSQYAKPGATKAAAAKISQLMIGDSLSKLGRAA